MKRLTACTAALAITVISAGCGNEEGQQQQQQQQAATSMESQPTVETNKRGAIEVPLGEPVTVETEYGDLLVSISNTRLDAEGCIAVDYDDIPELASEGLEGAVRQVQFAADIEVGDVENPEWLWASDFYFVGDDGEVVDQLDVSRMSDEFLFSCEGYKQILHLPPNSKAKGATSLTIPIGSENGGPSVIGYRANDQRVEWVLPENWSDELPPPTFAS